MKRTSLLRGLSLTSLMVIAAACSAYPDGSVDDSKAPDHDQAASLDKINFEIVDTDEQGVPNFIVGQVGTVSAKPGQRARDIEAAMFPILQKAAPLFRMKPEEMVLARGDTDREGDQHFRFQQYKNGLAVLGGEVIVHVRNSIVIGVNGNARGDYEAPVEAKLDEKAALEAAMAGVAELPDVSFAEEMPLAYKPTGDKLELVYLVDVFGEQRDTTPVHDTLLVSARDGSILDRIPHILIAKNREVHNLNHGTGLPGATSRVEGQGVVGETDVDTNYDRLGTVYDGYKTLFNRDSYNNAGAKLISSVHYSNNYVNAYWNGTQMVYGDGDGVTASSLARSLDVTAHELTHAVTSSTSNLTYSGESGGLNEAMSDILGNVIEWYSMGQPNPANANNFLVGEDCWTPGTAGDALRYMCDPAKDGSSLDYWTSSAGNVDVHYSSGIANLAFCLLVKGGTHPRGKSSVNVTGIGMAKAAQIFYKANTSIFTSSTNFAAAKTGTEQAATQLGYTAAEIASVTAAWQAVGVGVGGGGGSCSHDKCATGAALTSSCNSVVSAVCAADSYCCTTSWDSLCVSEDRTIGKSLKCSEANGTCAHNLCATGGALANSCDSAKANCVATLCASDSYCCTTAWDSICVGEVSSICAKNCN